MTDNAVASANVISKRLPNVFHNTEQYRTIVLRAITVDWKRAYDKCADSKPIVVREW